MVIYMHDNSFEGILTCIHEAYYRSLKPHRIMPECNLQHNILDKYIRIETDSDRAGKVYNAIISKISYESLQMLYHVYLSETPDAGTLIYNYLKMGFRVGSQVDLYLSNNNVLNVHKISRRVGHEVHILTGFIRFRMVCDNTYYAPLEPDSNVVALLAPHFAERLADQRWIIHDIKRGLAAVYDLNTWMMVDADNNELFQTDSKDLKYSQLWKEFFSTIAISSRTNPKLQKNLMPVRYWKHLTEKW